LEPLANWECRRKRAVQAVNEGQPRKTVAEVIGVHIKTIARWVRAGRKPGGFDAKPNTCPEPGLSDADLQKLERLLKQGAKAHYWHNQLWTAARVARLIEREDVLAFLAELHRRLGTVMVVWDRDKIHSKSRAVKAWLAKHPNVVAEDFPGYVPDLNPDECVWRWTKYGRLATLAASDKDELWDRVVDELVEVKFRPDLLRGFVRQTGLPGVSLAA
jgi:transposase